MLTSLSPRASRIDRDRLMIRLGQQSAARGAAPWKWATGASLMLALVLGVRPAIVSSGAAPAQLAIQSKAAEQPSTRADGPQHAEPHNDSPRAPERPLRDEGAWLMALASGRFDSPGMLTVRPRLATIELASRGGDGQVAGDSPASSPPARTPMLRWGDRRKREAVELAAPPRT
jgi:hypothetical protein